MLLCQQTHYKTFILSLGHSWTTLHSHKDQPYASNKTYEGSTACCRLIPHTHRLPSMSWCQSLCQEWELFFVEPEAKSQWIVLVGILLSQQMLAVIKHIVDDNIICLLAIQHMRSLLHVAHNTFQQLLITLSVISFELYGPQQSRVECNWLRDLGSLQQC